MAIQLGSKVRDSISGLSGIATGRATFLYGCVRVLIEPQELKDGKPIDPVWFDEQRVEVVEEKAPVVSADSTPGIPGGPQKDPPASASPTR